MQTNSKLNNSCIPISFNKNKPYNYLRLLWLSATILFNRLIRCCRQSTTSALINPVNNFVVVKLWVQSCKHSNKQCWQKIIIIINRFVQRHTTPKTENMERNTHKHRICWWNVQKSNLHIHRAQSCFNLHSKWRLMSRDAKLCKTFTSTIARLSASYSPFLALVGSFAFWTFSTVNFGHSQPHARNILNLKPNHPTYCIKNVTLETSAKSSRLSSSQGDQYSRTVWNFLIFPGLFAALIFLSVLPVHYKRHSKMFKIA